MLMLASPFSELGSHLVYPNHKRAQQIFENKDLLEYYKN